jgi:hypothetical protein
MTFKSYILINDETFIIILYYYYLNFFILITNLFIIIDSLRKEEIIFNFDFMNAFYSFIILVKTFLFFILTINF